MSSSICTVTAEENIIVSVNPANTIPTFSPIADICSGDALSLPGTSTNSISGTWSPAVNNTATTNYTFTPNAGQCATTQGLTVTVNQEVGPIFTQVLATCTGDAIVLPSTSTNSIVGSWSPAINNTATTTYTFTPDVGQCASDETMTVDVTPETIPSFSAIADICSGDALSLPGTSTNSISGTWTPAVNNTATTNYTFTPNAGQCATTQGLTVNVNAQTTPSFSAIADICSGDALSLPGTSTNSISGTWTPAVNNTATTNYTFTPNAGQCATTQGLTVNVNAQTTPSFSAIADICSGDALSLPGTSTNSISGTWTPAVNNTATTNYTFTPNAGQCATTQGLTVNVNAQTTPSFSAIADICSGDALSLPGTSTNSISGTWTPAVNNTATTNYTFTPNAGQCATTQGLTVNVNAQTTPSFSAIADICSGDALSLPGTSTNSISGTWTPAVNNTATTNYTFTPNAGQCATTQGLTVNVNAQTTPSFSAIADICSGDALSLPGTSTNSISGTWTPAVNNTATTNYTFTPNAGQCATTQGLTVNVNAQTTPSFSAIADICSGDALSLPGTSTNSISGTWTPAVNNTATTNYTFTPNAGQCATTQGLTVNVNAQTTPSFSAIADICSGDALSLPGTSTNSISGTWTPAVNNTATTNYTFTPNAGQCATTQGLTVNVNAQTTPSFSAIADICSGDALSLPGTSTNSISGTWTPAVNNTATTNYTFTPNAGQCATTQGLTVNVNAQTTPSFSAIADICSGDALSLPGTSTNSISGTWTPAVNNTATTNYTFTPNAGQCATTQGLTVNVNLIPQFTNSVLSDPSSCGGNDGSIVINGLIASSAYDLTYNDGTSNIGPLSITTDASGTYILGSITAGSYSSFIIADANCSFTVVPSLSLTDPSAPVFTSNSVASPSVCGGSDGEISLTGLVSNATYDLTYLDDGVSVGPITINSDASGIIALTGLNSGNYSSFVLDLSGCTGTDSGSITLTDPSAPELQITDPSAVCSPGTVDISVAAITSGSTGGGTLTYWTDASATTPLADQSAVGVSGMYYIQSESNGCTDIEAVNVVVNETPVVQITDPSAVCSPGTVDISVAAITSGSTGGGTLTYWTDASATTPLADQSAVGVSGMYYIQSESNGCTDIEAVNVVINSLPQFTNSVLSDPSSCGGNDGSIVINGLIASSAYDLTYNDGTSNIGPLSITTDASGTYILGSITAGSYSSFIIADANCSFTVVPSLSLTDPSAPVFTSNSVASPSVCGGSDGEISLTGLVSNATYDLTYLDDGVSVGPITINSDASGIIALTGLNSGNYSSFVLDLSGCTGSTPGSITLTDPPAPELQITDPSAVCSPGTVDISVAAITSGSTGGGTLTYWTDASATTPLADQSAVGVSGMYYIQSESNGCTDIEAVNVVVNETPVVQITDPSAVCSPGTVDISVAAITSGSTGGGTLTYWTDASATTPLADQSAVGVSGIYYIQSESNGCTDIEAVNVVVNETPSFTVSGTDPSVCNASDGFITIDGLDPSTDYTLSYDSLATTSQTVTITSDATGAFILNGFEAGLYDAFSITLNGCAFTAVESIDLNNPSAPSIVLQLDTVVCDTYSLGEITGDNLSGNEAYYSQSNGAGISLNAGDVITASQTVYIYDIIGACSDEASFTLTVNNTPELTNLTAQEACVSFELPTTIEGTNLSGNQNYYDAAQANGGALLTGPITTSQQVYMYDANGTCSDEVFFEVSINSLPEVVSFSGEGTYCEGETVESLTAALSGSGVLTLDYTIDGVSNSMNTSTASIDLGTAPGVYVLTQITDENCNNAVNLTQTITINTLPTAPNTSADVSYCANEQPDAMEADGSSGSYTWYADQELTDVLGSQTTYTPETILGSTSYYVTATENGCEGPAQMILIAFEECGIVIPTAFTPDGDQTNDTWSLNDIDVIYPNNVVSVYNRLGNKVYESIQGAYDQMPWDGTFNGEPLPVASYYFIIEYNDNTTPKSNGIVSIIK